MNFLWRIPIWLRIAVNWNSIHDFKVCRSKRARRYSSCGINNLLENCSKYLRFFCKLRWMFDITDGVKIDFSNTLKKTKSTPAPPVSVGNKSKMLRLFSTFQNQSKIMTTWILNCFIYCYHHFIYFIQEFRCCLNRLLLNAIIFLTKKTSSRSYLL